MSQHPHSPESCAERLTLTEGEGPGRSSLHVDTTGETQWLLEDASRVRAEHVADLAAQLRARLEPGAGVTLHVLDDGGEEDRRGEVAEAAGFSVGATNVVVVHDLRALAESVGAEPGWSLDDVEALSDIAAELVVGVGEGEELHVVTDAEGPIGVLGWALSAAQLEDGLGEQLPDEGRTADLTVMRVLPERGDVDARRLYRHALRRLADAGLSHALGTIDTADQELLDAAQAAGGESALVETSYVR